MCNGEQSVLLLSACRVIVPATNGGTGSLEKNPISAVMELGNKLSILPEFECRQLSVTPISRYVTCGGVWPTGSYVHLDWSHHRERLV